MLQNKNLHLHIRGSVMVHALTHLLSTQFRMQLWLNSTYQHNNQLTNVPTNQHPGEHKPSGWRLTAPDIRPGYETGVKT